MTPRNFIVALLYAAAALVANPALSGEMSAADRTAIEDMRSDSLRRLVIHESAQPRIDAGYFSATGESLEIPADGEIRLINFWATWCAPCREEMPALDALRVALEGEAVVMAIATGRNRLEDIERFNTETGISMPVNLDPRGEMASAYGVLGLPSTIILDGEGREIARLTGAADWAEAEGILRALAVATAD